MRLGELQTPLAQPIFEPYISRTEVFIIVSKPLFLVTVVMYRDILFSVVTCRGDVDKTPNELA
jgi:hypothetical protein